MKIGLVSSIMKNNNIEFQIELIEKYLKEQKGLDLIVFGESFLQGFDGITFDYEIDKYRALKIESVEINRIKDLAKKYNCSVSFGFIENDNNFLYSSNLVINENGDIIDVFRRVSKGWKEASATDKYKEGSSFHSFKLKGSTFTTAICGDLWG